MKFRIVETTGAPNFEPCRWQADCGRFKYVIIAHADGLDAAAPPDNVTFTSGLLGQGSDWMEIDSLCVCSSLDAAAKVCGLHLASIIAELQRALEEK
jgi:hypothetical protein